jgi:hypothetical protein
MTGRVVVKDQWPRERIKVAQLVWGDGFTFPGAVDFVLKLAVPLTLARDAIGAAHLERALASFGEVADEPGKRPVELRKEILPQATEVVGMGVPAATAGALLRHHRILLRPEDGDVGHARLDKPPGHEQARAVAQLELRRRLRQPEEHHGAGGEAERGGGEPDGVEAGNKGAQVEALPRRLHQRKGERAIPLVLRERASSRLPLLLLIIMII